MIAKVIKHFNPSIRTPRGTPWVTIIEDNGEIVKLIKQNSTDLLFKKIVSYEFWCIN
jgi:hypothetical protein